MSLGAQMEQSLRAALEPTALELRNESHQHSVAPGSETHWRLRIVSPRFSGLRPVARHRLVYAACDAALKAGVHALAVEAFSPEEDQGQGMGQSPACRGGNGL
jgi:BolA protein